MDIPAEVSRECDIRIKKYPSTKKAQISVKSSERLTHNRLFHLILDVGG